MNSVKGVVLNCTTRNSDALEFEVVKYDEDENSYHLWFEYGGECGAYDFSYEQIRNLRDFLNENVK